MKFLPLLTIAFLSIPVLTASGQWFVESGAFITGYDVVLIAGQSNAAGWGHFHTQVYDPTDPRIVQLPDAIAGPVIRAEDPLSFPDYSYANGLQGSDRMGAALTFARCYRGVLLVPAAYAGTNIIGGGAEWTSGNPGGRLFENAIKQAGRALALNARNTFVGIFWSQGESEAAAGVDATTYATARTATLNGLRSRVGNSNAWVLAMHFTAWSDSNLSNATAIEAGITSIGSTVTNAVSYTVDTGNDGSNGYDPVHFTAAGQLLNGNNACAAGHAAGFY
jgi:hypothetical protein